MARPLPRMAWGSCVALNAFRHLYRICVLISDSVKPFDPKPSSRSPFLIRKLVSMVLGDALYVIQYAADVTQFVVEPYPLSPKLLRLRMLRDTACQRPHDPQFAQHWLDWAILRFQ